MMMMMMPLSFVPFSPFSPPCREVAPQFSYKGLIGERC